MSGAYSMRASVASVLGGWNVSRPKEAISREKALLGAWTVRKTNAEGPDGLSYVRRGIYMHGTSPSRENTPQSGVEFSH